MCLDLRPSVHIMAVDMKILYVICVLYFLSKGKQL